MEAGNELKAVAAGYMQGIQLQTEMCECKDVVCRTVEPTLYHEAFGRNEMPAWSVSRPYAWITIEIWASSHTLALLPNLSDFHLA